MRSRPSPSTSSSASASRATGERDRAVVAHLGDVPHAPQDAVRHPRRPARAAGDLLRRLVGDLDAEDPGRAADDPRELLGAVVVEPVRHAEAVAERRRQEARARRRADERERRQVERQRPRRRPLADDDVEPEVLERRVEDLLDGAVQPVDLVHEEDVALLERGEDRGHVALALERRARRPCGCRRRAPRGRCRRGSSCPSRAGRRGGRGRAPPPSPSPPRGRWRAAP